MRKLLAIPVLTLPLAAFAAVPADVTTALTDGKADAIVVASAVLVIVFAIAVFKWMKSAK